MLSTSYQIFLVSQCRSSVRHVIDGGALLQLILWKRGITYLQILQKSYGIATIVFVGYSSVTSTKDMTHQRLTCGIKGTVVQFDDGMVLTVKKELFVLNIANKHLSIHLEENSSRLKMLTESEHFRKYAEILSKDNATSKEIIEAREILFMYLYKGKGTEDLDKMRYNTLCETLATSKSNVEPEMLPPTSDAAKYQFEICITK